MDLQVGGIYSFSVYPVAVLGTDFKNVLIMADLDAETAQLLGFDIQAKHALVSPSLPSTTQTKDPTKYHYVRIKYPSGKTDILAIEWINPLSVVAVNLGRFTIIIDDESSSSAAKIVQALAANNFKVKSIDFAAVMPT